MKDHINTRLQQLKAEYQKGQERLAALEQETISVKNAMLRISGAIQALEELLEQDPSTLPKNGIPGNPVEAVGAAPR